MKVISGKYKGRNILGYDIEGTRPTQDRVKESLFGMIQNYVQDSVVLDLFAGSGNLGIEALSNFCKYAYFVDNNKIAIDIINKNIKNIGIENCRVIKNDYNDALNNFKNNNIKFDIVFLDPPYKDKIIVNILDKLVEFELLNENAIIICEAECLDFVKEYEHYELIKEKKYGYKYIYIYKFKG